MIPDPPISPVNLLEYLSRHECRPQVVCQLGNMANLASVIFEHGQCLPLFGSMGMVLPVSLGVAMGTPKQIVAIEGDGGLLMNLGALATTAALSPPNLLLIVADNAGYQTTGGQPVGFSVTKGIHSVLEACGWADVRRVSESGFENAIDWGMQPGMKALVIEMQQIEHSSFPKGSDPCSLVRAFHSVCG